MSDRSIFEKRIPPVNLSVCSSRYANGYARVNINTHLTPGKNLCVDFFFGGGGFFRELIGLLELLTQNNLWAK